MKKVFPFLIIYFIVTILYYPVFTTYFSQDDFFHFKVSLTDGTFKEFLNLFGFHSFEERGIAFYRPIFREFLYNTFYSLFGLNPIPFRTLSFVIHFINIFLTLILIQTIFQRKVLSFFVAFFFGISSPNVATLYYLSGGIQALGATMFILLTLIVFIRYLETNNIKYAVFAFLTFLLSLGSHELAATTPVLLAGLSFIYLPFKKGLKKIRVLIPFFIILAVYLYLEITKIGFSTQELQYQITLNVKTLLNSLMWYSGWALGLPEMLIDFVSPGFKLNPTLMRYWGKDFTIIFISFALITLILAINIIKLFISKKGFFKDRRFWFFVFWFPITLLPVIFLPQHKSSYYLALSLPALWTAVGLIILAGYRFFKVIFIIAALLLFATTANLATTTYPAATRGKLAEKIIKEITTTYPTLPKGAVIYFKNDPDYPNLTAEWGGSSRQVSFILNGSDALQLLYKDPTLKVYYEDLNKPPTYDSGGKIYEVTVKIL